MTPTFALGVHPAVEWSVFVCIVFVCLLYARHMLIPRACVCVNVKVPVCVFTGFLPCSAVEFLADYSGDALLCFPAEAGASPLVALAPSVPPSSFLTTGTGCHIPCWAMSIAKETEA